MSLNVRVDENLIAELERDFDMRPPNVKALRAVIERLESGNFDPMEPMILDLATGAGKTWVMASLVEYLRRQGHSHVMVITPTTVVQSKTVRDFSCGSDRYISGFRVPPSVITPDDVHHLQVDPDQTHVGGMSPSEVFIFNVQQLFPPKNDGSKGAQEQARRRTWAFQEASGVLGETLADMDDLVVIIDEVHLFGPNAKIYQQAFKALKPAATVGLTASADKGDDVIYRYPLYQALADGYVKQPVLVYRESGYDSDARQLQDGLTLLRRKEEAYATWAAANPRGKQTKPLLFVVCADVKHATDTANLLKTPKYFGSDAAVLQVDNKHNDATTQAFLANLDSPTSPVRCIVNVNKLREGWDTKRIGVMCTLRAMGSEVLTQQVMGRGLRLPFGSLTGNPVIDELDILSHESFVKLLSSENVLRQFGIDGAVKEGVSNDDVLAKPGETKNVVDEHVGQTHAGGGESQPQAGGDVKYSTDDPGQMGIDDVPADDDDNQQAGGFGSSSAGFGGVGSRGLKDDDDIDDVAPDLTPTTVKVNQAFAGTTFSFPASTMRSTKPPFNLTEIDNEQITEYARKVHDAAELLKRRKIVADAAKGEVSSEELESVAVKSTYQAEAQVRNDLIRRVTTSGLFANNATNKNFIKNLLVPKFMEKSGIDQWTENARESAATLIRQLITDTKAASDRTPHIAVEVTPRQLPVMQEYSIGCGTPILAQLDIDARSTKKSTGFDTASYYGPWLKGLFDAAQFDSFTGEYRLAARLNVDPDVEWWTRLYTSDGAKIAYSPTKYYYPDFVVRAKDGKYWIVEGKSVAGRDDEIVQAKKKAAEKLMNIVASMEEFDGQQWGYIIAYEDDIADSKSFADLIDRAGQG